VSDPAAERVLVISTAQLQERAGPEGLFQGYSPAVDRFLPWLFHPTHLCYLPRSQAETDPSFKQLIPYIVLRCGGEVFHYTRGKSGTEARLRALRSVGVGGHICQEDGAAAAGPYRTGMLRELAEEVQLDTPFKGCTVGLINDDRTPVGRVHLGIVHVLDLAEPRVLRREEAITECGFAPVSRLRRQCHQFETWSQFLLEGTWLDRPEEPSPMRS
jgi:predicted NUDIX family phosphoesterase